MTHHPTARQTQVITRPFASSDPAEGAAATDRVKGILKPLLMRRTLQSVDSAGQSIVRLPPIHERRLMVELSDSEREFYDSLRACVPACARACAGLDCLSQSGK